MEAPAWPVQDLFEGGPFDTAPPAARPPNGGAIGGGCGVGAVPELGGALNGTGGLLFDVSPGADGLTDAKEPDDPVLLFSAVTPVADAGPGTSFSGCSDSWGTPLPGETEGGSGAWSAADETAWPAPSSPLPLPPSPSRPPPPPSRSGASVKAEAPLLRSPLPPPPPRSVAALAAASLSHVSGSSSLPSTPLPGAAAAAAAAVTQWTARWSANGLLLAEPEDFSAGSRRELRRRLRCVKSGRGSPTIGGSCGGGSGRAVTGAAAVIKKEGAAGGRGRTGVSAAAGADRCSGSVPLTPAEAAMHDRRQARVIRNREVALRARRAAKEKMTALVEENGAMAARVESLVVDNERLKQEVAQLRARLA
ncbi:hypothetical protein MMPV_006191 [Pyropia vietnamensis]